ncbi:Rhodanese-like domain-containing protein [Pilobolus umbonatus]|nr:Rhodanese-like domain-containing protein [Pilobolus umbonatus]
MPSANTVPSPIKINDMTVAELHQLIKKEKNMPVFIDVREPNEIEAQGKISGATNIPFGLTKTDPSLFNAALREIIPNKEDKLIISCRSGRRSLFAAEYLVDNLGYSNIYNVAGGILDWIDHQYPVQAYSNNHSPWVHSFTSNHPYYAVIDLEILSLSILPIYV